MTSSNQNGWDRKYALTETDLHDTNLADDIGAGWKDLARALAFKQAFIDTTEKENNCEKECCIRVLVSWLQKEGEDATAEKIYEALVKIGRKSLAEMFPCKPSDPSQNPEAVIHDLEEKLAKMSARSKELEAENFRQSARIKELEEMIQKNKAVWETVSAAVQEMEKNPEQRREESLNRINSEVQELQQQLKRVKLDMVFTDEHMVSSVDRKNTPKDKEPKNDLLCHDAMVPQQDKVHLLQSCEEQLSFCRGIFDALARLIGEVGQLKHDEVIISKLWNFTKEFKDQEKQLLFSLKIESLNSLKDNLYEDQTAELDNLAKWYKALQEQLSQLEKLLSTLLCQGKSTKSQGTKTDPSQIPSELQNSSRLTISEPFGPLKMSIMDRDKKPEEGQSVRHSKLRHNTAPSGKKPKQQNDETIELARRRLKTYPSEETLGVKDDKAD